MPIDTPDWVRDAVFYQIFPDRFASSRSCSGKPGPLEPWDAPPTSHGFKGGDLLRLAERLPYLADLGVNAPLPDARSSRRPRTTATTPTTTSQVDPLLGGNDALRELLDAAHARGHAGRARRRVQPHGPRVLGVPPRPGERCRLAVPRLVPLPPGGARRPAAVPAVPVADGRRLLADRSRSRARRHDQSGDESFRHLGYRAWWGLPALPKLNTANPEVREHLMAVAEHWLRFGIDGWRLDVPDRDPRRGVLAGVPAPLPGSQPGGLHRRRDLARVPGVAGRRPVRRGHELPARRTRSSGLPAQGHLDEEVVRQPARVRRRHRAPATGPAFGAELERLMRLYDPAVTEVQLNLLDSHDSPRFRTIAGGDPAAWRLAVLLQATLPGAPVHLLRRRGRRRGRPRPGLPARVPVGRGGLGRATAWRGRAPRSRMRHELPALRRGAFRVAGSERRRRRVRARRDGGGAGDRRRQRGRRRRRAARWWSRRSPGGGFARWRCPERRPVPRSTIAADGTLRFPVPARTGVVLRGAG